MTRLFIRFYLGVVLILIAAWLLQSWFFEKRFEIQNAQVVRDALFGGVRNARDKYRYGVEQDRLRGGNLAEVLLNQIKEQFDYPVRLHEVNPNWDFDAHLADGEDHGLGEGTFIMAKVLPGEAGVLLFGPVPRFSRPSKLETAGAVGVVFLLAAAAIALLLRPVARQFQVVETAASGIASGDLATRIEPQRGVASSKLVRAFNEMAGKTEDMVQNQKELLQAVSHELRTPLSRIHFATDLIRAADDTERESKLQALESAADDLDSLVGELLAYVRMEQSTAPPTRENIDLQETVRTVFDKTAMLFPERRFETELTNGTSILCDSEGLTRVITNLVSNAARFAKSVVRVSAKTEGDTIALCVDDDGPGIPVGDRERVFEPFVRLSDSGTGVGLGLAIVKRILEQHGAEITVTKSPPGGCRIQTVWPNGAH